MTRRVVIERDTASPLWVVRCAEPAECCAVCWLGSSFTREGAEVLAAMWKYEVADAAV